MPRNGSGVYTAPANTDGVPNATIESSKYNAFIDDLETALTGSVAADGQTPMTGALAMGSQRITGLANATALTDATAAGQVQNGAFMWGGTAGGTADVLTISLTPALTAYAAGQTFRFKVGASANTASATLNVNSLGAKTIKKKGGAALLAGDLPASTLAQVVYDGTDFLLTEIFVRNRNYAEYTANADLTTIVPRDDTIPQNTEGTEVLTVAITPSTTSSRIRISVSGWGSAATTGDTLVVALFKDSGADAVHVVEAARASATNVAGSFSFVYEEVPATVSEVTYKLRVGGVSGTVRLNGTSAARRYGGASKTTMVAEEL